jgi:preprotein translocase subunit SecG
MKVHKFSLFLILIPLFILAWGFFNLYFFDPFYAHAPDPEYPYLLNGLNVALLEFNRIAHFDHPGTPFQVYCGIIIRLTHLFAGKDAISQDVISRPEYYLSAISFSLVILQALLCFFIAWAGKKRGNKTWQLIILQSGVLFSVTMLAIYGRVIPERWLVVVAFLFIIVYLLYGYKDQHPLKFAIWSGIIMGMGMATKFNFLPIILLPFLLINSNINRLVYGTTGVASFFFFLLPIIKKFGYFRKFVIGIATHDGIYGGGEERMFDPARVKEGFFQIFDITPALAFIITALVAAIIIAIIYRKKHETNRPILFFAGMLFITLLQMIMVAKHFRPYYMLPLITMYPVVLFILDDFIQKTGNYKKWTLLPVILLFMGFTCITTKRTYNDIQSEKRDIVQREIVREFVSDNLPDNTLWIIDVSWITAPYVENGIAYGLCYVRKPMDYFSELTNVNPNIITNYFDETARIWKGHTVPLDSIVVTRTPIHLYSSYGRTTATLMEVLKKTSRRNDVTLSIDTIFSNNQRGRHIIVMQNKNSQKDWNTEEFISSK